MSNNVERPVRTGVQAGGALVIVEFLDAFIFDMSEKQYGAAVAMLALVLAIVMGFVDKKYPLLGRVDE